MSMKKTPTPKKPSPAKKAAKPRTSATKKPTPTTPKAHPAPSKWRLASPPPPKEPGRELMVIPQPEPLTPWQQFKADLPGSFDRFIEEVMTGQNLTTWCQQQGIPRSTLVTWIAADPQKSDMYTRAKRERADFLFEEIVAISDEAEVVTVVRGGRVELALDPTAVARNKLRIDARKWAASKLRPETYGDKLEIGGTVNHQGMSDDQLLGRLASLGIALASITPPPQGVSDA